MSDGFIERRRAIEAALQATKPRRFERIVDRVLEPFAPGLVAQRMKSRQELGYRRAMLSYVAAMPSYNRIQTVEPLTTEEAMLPGYSRFQLILDSRDLYRNSPIVRAGVDGMARRSVATGIMPEFRTDDMDWNRKAEDRWRRFCELCDVRAVMCLDGICRQAVRSCFYDGDIGIKFVEDQDELRLQIIEADLIAPDFRVSVNIDTWNPIGGVVLDWNTGRPLGYYVGRRGVGGLLVDSELVPAESMLLLYRAQRVDQVRGIPLLAPVLNTARDLEFYLEATQLQANIAATYGVVVKRDAAAQIGFANSELPSLQNPQANYRTMRLPTGRMIFLNPGESIESFHPDVPSPVFDSYARFLVRMIAIGMGTTYEMLMQDFAGMSFSSSRTTLLDTTLQMQAWQRWLIQRFLKPTYYRWVAKEMHSGKLPFNEQAYDGIGWHLPAELGVDPQRDAQADVTLLASGLETFENLLQQAGKGNARDWLRKKADEVQYIHNLAKERGVPPELISSTLPPGVQRSGEEILPTPKNEVPAAPSPTLPERVSIAEGQLAVHPVTGERIRWLKGQWVKVNE